MLQLLVRGVAGGIIVSGFALLGDVLKPKSFAGLFGAAPSVALASLALAFHSDGAVFVAAEAHSMVAGAIGFAVYAAGVCVIVRGGRRSVRLAAIAMLPLWLLAAFATWWLSRYAHHA